VLKIKALNQLQGKNLDGFKILSKAEAFKKKVNGSQHYLLFAPTVHGKFYLLHEWGKPLSWLHKLKSFPLRSFETLSLSLLTLTFITTISLPTHLITLDRDATYWCMYRFPVFFHLLIFYSGFTTYALFGFNKPFSGSVWENDKSL
jgi:hypothetical protein